MMTRLLKLARSLRKFSVNTIDTALSVTLVQSDLTWEDCAANRDNFTSLFQGLPDTDLVILPEMFTTGFSMASEELSETMDGPTINWMKTQASVYNTSICGSLIIEEENQFYNRFVLVSKDGKIQSYDKKHLFRMSGEHHHYQAGESRLIASINGFRICPQVCYDLRFPAWSRNTEIEKPESDYLKDTNSGVYDLLIYVANWPKSRRLHWLTLLQARAIENQSYVIGVNRSGIDGNEIQYSGDSGIYDFNGNCLMDLENNPNIQTYKLQKAPQSKYREDFPAWKDAEGISFY
ncbi:MAG: omega-amidase [Candidatus Azotimanducaceae bacterium]|jgi:omega-amidase